MTRISVGCGVSAAITTFSTPIPVVIAATVAPAMSPLYDGQAVQDVPGYATMVDMANFASSGGAIVSAVVAFTGDALNASAALFDGDTAGFTVTVTDSADNVRVFTASEITVVHAAPAATGGIADQSFVQNGAITPLDLSADFTGLGLTYALAPSSAALPAGLGLSSSGILSGTPTALASALAIVVRATNSGGFADTAFAITVDAAEITATIAPAMSTIHHGDAVQDVTNYATMISTGNFASTAGTISSAVVGFLGDAVDASTALSDGDTAGFTVTVTDSAANVQVFTASAIAITHTAPVAAGGLADRSYGANAAVSAFDVSADFTGLGLTHALAPSSAPLPAGLSLSGAGVITGTPTTAAAQANIVVRATNSGGFADTAFGITILAETITATITPAMSPLYDGQAVQDVPGYAAMVAAGNFTAIAGRTIVSAVVAFTGDAIAADDALVEGETAGFTVTVTDSESYVQVFTASQITVQYKVTVNATVGNEVDIDVNPLVPDAETLSITISAGPHAGTYTTLTAGDLRDGPANFPGTIAITGNTGLGDTLTVDDGLWTTPTASLTLTRQFQSDDVDISGATASTFVITASEQGTDVTVEVTGDDGTNPTVTAESAALGIPGGAATLTLTQIGAPIVDTAANTIAAFNQPIDLGAAKTNKIGIIVIAYGQAAGGAGVTLTVNGGQAIPAVANTEQRPAIQANSAIYAFDASAGGNHTINFAPTGAWRGWQMAVYTAEKSDDSAPILSGSGTSQSGSALMDLSQTVAVGDEIVGAIMSGDYTVQSPVALVGLTRDGGVQYTSSGSKEAYLLEATADAAGNRTMTADPAGGAAPISFSLLKVS